MIEAPEARCYVPVADMSALAISGVWTQRGAALALREELEQLWGDGVAALHARKRTQAR